MDVLLAGDFDAGEREDWLQALGAAMPEARWHARDDPGFDPGRVTAAVVANPPPGSLRALPRLALIQSLWAGVDRLLADPTLPEGVPIARMVDPAMNRAMAETALWAVIALQRDFFVYGRQQQQGLWRQHAQRRPDDWPVLVLGMGEMGRTAARALVAAGYPVSGWSRNPGVADAGVERLSGDVELWRALPLARVLVNLLPLTAQTQGLLGARLFDALPRGAALVNLARGRHVVDDELLAALDDGRLSHAVLDVFHQEPLPPAHPYWRHERVTLLPHVAAQTDARSAAAVAVTNLRALRDGLPLQHRVDRGRGY
ncbi:MAG: glyoxylate/hydroxypyruvate reductase A [Rubrivivax sp.]